MQEQAGSNVVDGTAGEGVEGDSAVGGRMPKVSEIRDAEKRQTCYNSMIGVWLPITAFLGS